MKLNLYSVHDEKAQAFRHMFFRRHDGEALRFFQDGVQDAKTELSKHPSDFALYVHGVFDDETGDFQSYTPVKFVCRASEFVQMIPQLAMEASLGKDHSS